MMTMPEIERCLRQLRLSGVRDTLQTRVLQAQGANQPFLETFSLILQDELDRRQSRLIERRYQQSGLDEKLTLAEFDWSFNPKLPRQTCFQLHTLAFIAAGENALLVGKPGTGKSHIAKAIAYQAILQSHKVQYLETDDFCKRRSRPTRKGLAWGLQSVDQRVCKSLAGGMEAATTENYEVRPNDQGRSSSIRDCG
ncbi:DNA replication protein DnaC [Bradyrhizobium japonicum]|jgi:DNA replication protein DnaC